MSQSTFEQSIELLIRCDQRTAFLHNFGEPLLHPLLAEYVRHCTSRGVEASFFTNGVSLTADLLDDLESAGLATIYLSEHTQGERARIQQLIAASRSKVILHADFRPRRRELHSWAGQVAIRSGSIGRIGMAPCLFERELAAVVLWDGRVNVCCIDDEARGVRGTVTDYLDSTHEYEFRPIPLCDTCDLMRGEEDLS